MNELESFARDWEAHERSLAAARLRVALSRSRHAELMRDLKREFRAEPKSAAVEEAPAAPHSLQLPPAVPRRQSYSRYPGRGVSRSDSGSATRSPRQPK